MRLRNKIIIGSIPILCVGFFFCLKPVIKNISVESSKYKTPANKSFTDMNFYKCVIDNYNAKYAYTEWVSKLSYDDNITNEQLEAITNLDCAVTSVTRDNDGNIISKSFRVDDDGNPITGNDIIKFGLDIKDTNGIEKLSNLKKLSMEYDTFSSINLSQNSLLEDVSIVYNSNVSQIDFSSNLNITSIILRNNKNLSYVNFGNNTNLTSLDISNNKFKGIDLSSNPNISNYINAGQKETIYLNKYECSSINFEDSVLLRLLQENNYSTDTCSLFDQLYENKTSLKVSTNTDYYVLRSDDFKDYYNFDYYIIPQYIKTSSDILGEDDGYIFSVNRTVEEVLSHISFNGVSHSVTNNNLVVKYSDDLTIEYPIVIISSDLYSNDWLLENYLYGDSNDVISNIDVLNGSLVFDGSNNVYLLKHNDLIIKQYNYINATSDVYDMSLDTLIVDDDNIEDFLSKINCINCSAVINRNNSYNTVSGEFNSGDKLSIVIGSNPRTILKTYNLAFSVKGVSLKNDNLNLNVSDTSLLSVDVFPVFASNKSVVWESSNSDVATVDSNGLVTAVGLGNAIITVRTVDGSFTDTCSVEVSNVPSYTVTYVNEGNESTHDYEVGESIDLPDLSKTGYIFDGWIYNGNFYTSDDTLIMPSQNIELEASFSLIIPEIDNYKISHKVINNVQAPTNVSNFDLGLGELYIVKLYNKDNQLKESGYIATGDKVSIYLSDNTFVTSYDIAVKGDVNGDGLITPVDFYELYVLRKKESDNQNIKLIYKLAGDLNKDGIITPADIFSLYEIKKIFPNL